MEKWDGETENLIKAMEIGLKSSIEHRRRELAYSKELESVCYDIFLAYSRAEIKDALPSVQRAWDIGLKWHCIKNQTL